MTEMKHDIGTAQLWDVQWHHTWLAKHLPYTQYRYKLS